MIDLSIPICPFVNRDGSRWPTHKGKRLRSRSRRPEAFTNPKGPRA